MSVALRFGLLPRRRIKLVRQTEIAECGLSCLAMIASYHGLSADLQTLRRRFEPSLRGSTLRSLMAIADDLGLIPRAVKVDLDGLGGLHVPALLHWDLNHYVVLERVAGGKALIHNPAGSSQWLTLVAVSPHFTGIALELRPTDEFEPVNIRERLRFSQLWSRMTGLKRALIQTIVLSMILEAFVLISPYYMQISVDSALPALDNNLLVVMAIGFGLFTIINSIATLLRSFVLLSAGTTLGYSIAVNVARRLFRLRISWFEKRHVGDVLSRFQSVTPIQNFMTQGAIGAIIDGSLAVFVVALMFYYSVTLTILALSALLLYTLVRTISFALQRKAQETVIVTSGREQSVLIESLRAITTLRLFRRETTRHAAWQSCLTDATNASISLARVFAWQNAVQTLIFGIENVLSIFIAIKSVMAGGFSLGMVFAYFAYKTQLVQRGLSLIDEVIAFRMLGLHLERLSDISFAEQDKSFVEGDGLTRELVGKIELKAISFRYSPYDPVILRDIALVVEAGDHVAISGPSGQGKTTLVKLILGLIEPDEGEILVDGIPLAKFGYKNLRKQTSAVLQDDSLLSGSLSDNITLFEEQADQSRIEDAAHRAGIHDEILAMPMGYDTLVGDMGSTLSGGQKQRLLLARAIYRGPKLLVMDEGTSHLDPAKEQIVNLAVSAMGITRIVIAHRLETIMSADKVYVVADGRIKDMTEHYASLKRRMAEDAD